MTNYAASGAPLKGVFMRMLRVNFLVLAILSEVAVLHAQTYEQYLTQSRAALTAKQYKEAQAAAETAIKVDPNRWEGYVLAANAYSSQHLYDDAIGMLQLALPRAPEDKKQLIRDAITDARKQAAGPPAPAVNSPAPNGPNPTMQEIVLWKTIDANPSKDNLNTYLNAYPNGAFAPLARDRLKNLVETESHRAFYDGYWKCQNEADFTYWHWVYRDRKISFEQPLGFSRDGSLKLLLLPANTGIPFEVDGVQYGTTKNPNKYSWDRDGLKIEYPTLSMLFTFVNQDQIILDYVPSSRPTEHYTCIRLTEQYYKSERQTAGR